MLQTIRTRASHPEMPQPVAADAPTVELARIVATERTEDPDRSLAVGRLRLLGAVLGDMGLSGFVRGVSGDGLACWPVLFITDPPAPWAVSAGPVSFWRGDPVRYVAPCQRALEAAWIVAEFLGRRP
jgi:hypothetical protein